MEPILDYYAINIIDIWPYERSLFFNEKTTEERVLLVEKKTIKVIIDAANLQQHVEGKSPVEPFTDLKRYDSGEHDGYWIQRLQRWDRASGNSYERIALDFFLHQDAFYSFTQDIEIDLTNEDFDFWFSLKLRQYDVNIKHLSKFLDFQLNSTFKDDIPKMREFLKLLLIQYEDEILPPKVVRILNDWTNNLKENPDIQVHAELKNESIIEVHKTFYLDIVRDQPRILVSNNAFFEALALLKKNILISENTNFEQFRRIFQSKALEENELIQWEGSLIELKWFVQQICRKGICSHINGIEKWYVAMHCFMIKNNDKQWVKIDKYTKISNANGAKTKQPILIEFGKKLKAL
jgi:hypothetical protein